MPKNYAVKMPSEAKQAKPVFGKRPPKMAIESAANEMKENPPAILSKTRRKKGKKASQKQAVAIMFNKARKAA